MHRGPEKAVDACDILTNCRQYPRDEAPAAYKDFDDVLRSVKAAGLATKVARLKAQFEGCGEGGLLTYSRLVDVARYSPT